MYFEAMDKYDTVSFTKRNTYDNSLITIIVTRLGNNQYNVTGVNKEFGVFYSSSSWSMKKLEHMVNSEVA